MLDFYFSLPTLFVFLVSYLIQKFEYFFGKNLGVEIYIEFLFFYTLILLPNSIHIGVLIASIMTFGNLSNHSEITAIQSCGISVLRTIRYPLLISIFVSLFALFFNDRILPKASLRAYSLLYDIRKKKPTVEFEEGVFYNKIPDYSIKIGSKNKDNHSVKDLLIYDHSDRKGNTQIIVADSGYISFDTSKRYLIMDIFNGNAYIDIHLQESMNINAFAYNTFNKGRLLFDLESYRLQKTNRRLFMTHNMMKTTKLLLEEKKSTISRLQKSKGSLKDKLAISDNHQSNLSKKPLYYQKIHSDDVSYRDSFLVFEDYEPINLLVKELDGYLRHLKSEAINIPRYDKKIRSYSIDIVKKYSYAIITVILFLVGAPLGLITRRGGLGTPIFLGTSIFILYYVVMTFGTEN